MRLFLIRHGETEQNISGYIQGQQPGVLTERGKLQAQALAQRLKSERFDYAFSSDLARAVDTLKSVLKFHPDLQIIREPAIRERALGVYEGRPGQCYHDEFIQSGLDRLAFKPEGGESSLDLARRTGEFLQRMQKLPPESQVLICTHGGPITTILAALLDAAIEEMLLHNFHNTSLTIVDMINGMISVKCFNSIDHLEGIKVAADRRDEFGT